MANLDNNDKIFGKFELWHLLTALIVANIIILFLPFIITNYNLGLNVKFDNNIGATLDGTMSPFIAMIASFLTFIAFWVQYKANQEQRKQFKEQKIQNENQNNFQLFLTNLELIESKTLNTNYKYKNDIMEGYSYLVKICDDLLINIKNECYNESINMIIHHVDYFNEHEVKEIIYLDFYKRNDMERYYNEFINIMRDKELDYSFKNEYLKTYIHKDNLSYEKKELLKRLYHKRFYKNELFSKRIEMYCNTFDKTFEEHYILIHNLINSFKVLMIIYNNSNNKESLILLLKTQFTTPLLVILYYFLMSGKCSSDIISFCKIVMEDVSNSKIEKFLIDNPDIETIKKEIENIYEHYDKRNK